MRQRAGIKLDNDLSRFDVRIDAQGVPNFIEVNPLPGLSPVSGDIVIMTRASGKTYEDLIGRVADEAIARHPALGVAARSLAASQAHA